MKENFYRKITKKCFYVVKCEFVRSKIIWLFTPLRFVWRIFCGNLGLIYTVNYSKLMKWYIFVWKVEFTVKNSDFQGIIFFNILLCTYVIVTLSGLVKLFEIVKHSNEHLLWILLWSFLFIHWLKYQRISNIYYVGIDKINFQFNIILNFEKLRIIQ